MSSRIAANIEQTYKGIGEHVAARLLMAAILVETTHMHNLNKSNPRPYLDSSKPGEYPRKRTGYLQANVGHYPASPTDVLATGYVDVGYTENGFYGEALVTQGRLGIEDTVEQLRTQLEAIVAGGG